MPARRANARVIYQGVDISRDVSNDLLSISYTDAFDEADKADITLRDDSRKWLLRWKPQRGERFSVSLLTQDWRFDGDSSALDCGEFLVDRIRYAGKPTSVTIGGVSMPSDQDFSGSPQNRTWEKATLSEIAESLLPNGYTLDFRADDDPEIEYVEQKETDDCAFLHEIAKKYAFRIKFYKDYVVVAAAEWLESQAPAFTITEETLFSWDFDAMLARTKYDACTVKYKHPKTEQEIEYTFTAPGAAGEKVYESSQAVSSVADAERVAKAELREQNQNETTASLSLMGRPDVFAGTVCRLSGFGDFDGDYLIDQATHNLSSGGYTTDLSLRRCLEGY